MSRRAPEGAELAAAIEGLLARHWGTAVAVTDLVRLSGGASRQTFSFDAAAGGERHPLILQRERAGGMRAATGMGIEAALVRAAESGGVPVAPIVVAEGDAAAEGTDLGGPWLVAERVEGETIARRILRDEALAGARAALATQCGAALAAIHRIPVELGAGLAADDPIQAQHLLLDQLGQPHPALELGLRWLATNRPASRPPVVVHGDFRNGNLVVGPDGLRAVLDWELAHIGDPIEDLGWLCARAWRFGEALPVGGFGERADLVAAYEAAGGGVVDAASLHWWELFATVRWGVICIVQAATHRLGLARSVELAAIGRRVSETEHDVLQMLDVELPVPTPAATPDPAPHDVPTAVELLEAVGEYLTDDVSGATDGRVRFHARVAANVVAMVAREIALGDAPAVAHRARLAGLGAEDDAALAAAVRAGSFDGRWAEVCAAVAASVADKVAVANPGYGSDRATP